MDKLENQLNKLNQTVDDMKKNLEVINDMKKNLDTLVAISTDKMQYQDGVARRTDRGPNPWAIQTSRMLTAAMNSLNENTIRDVGRSNFETYKLTLDALDGNPDGLTADQVSKKTGRRRNTESAYLYKMSNAGLIERKRKNNKIVYKLDSKEKVEKAFLG
jgi:hypothetical protein